MEISTQEIRALAQRMRLNLTDEEVKAYAKDIASLETLAGALLHFSESACEENGSPMPLCQLREDRVEASLSHCELFANASRQNGVFFTVPRVIGEGDA